MDNATATAQTLGKPHGTLQLIVSRVLRRLSWVTRVARLLAALCAWLVVLGLWVVLDALFPLSVAVRFTLLLLLMAAGVAAIGWAFWPRREDTVPLRGASRVEQQLTLDTQPLVTAMTLDRAAVPNADALTEALRSRANDRADAAAHDADPRAAVPLALLLRPLGWLAGVLLLWVVLAMLFPTLPGTGLARFFAPAADVPPFSFTRFAVSWVPEQPKAGASVRVLGVPSGQAPAEVDLVILNDALTPIERRQMRAEDDGWVLTFVDLRGPVTFYLEAQGRRTRRYTITPEPLPPPPMQQPGHTTTDGNTEPFDAQPNANTGGDPGSAADPNTAQAGTLPQGLGDLADLINDLALLAELADAAGEAGGTTDTELAEQLEAMLAQAASLAEAMQDAAPSGSEALSDALARLAQSLSRLDIEGLPAAPVQGAAPADSQQWRETAAQAARNDAARLAQGLGEAQTALASGQSSNAGTDPPDINRDPDATGGYDETLGDGADGPLPDALMQQVPPRYRDQTADYFRRLADRSPRPNPDDTPAPQEDTP